jgi:outer membrane receptor protein involved in Fe transport
MKYYLKKSLLLFLIFAGTTSLIAQTTVTGTITDGGTQQPLEGVNIAVLGSIQGTTTNSEGKYTLTVNLPPPFTVAFSYLGFHTEEVEIKENSTLDIIMIEEALFGQEIVISASRLKQRILLSPVTIEKMDVRFIQQTASADFYDAMANMKGVQVTNSSLNFTSVNTRGFADVTNSRFVQLVDGMDTADPSINSNLGSITGLGELDIESLELLPGAASALYGPNAFNGIMIMKSKSPFDYQGLSLMTKVGFTNSEAGGSNPMSIYSLRFAKAFNDKIAFKINAYYLGAQDWTANDYKTDRNNPGSATDLSNEPYFDGVNLHGDESIATINAFGIETLSRTGIKEEDLLDHNDARTRKADAAIHYRMNDKLELIGVYRYAGGSSLGQSNTKYAYRNFAQEFYKLELKADNFFVRHNLSITNIEDTYDVGALGAYVNEYFNPSQREDGSGWFEDYIFAYLGAIPGVSAENHPAARTYADRFMIDPATGDYVASFQDVLDQIRPIDYQSNPPGPSFYANSYISNSEVYYNFNQIKWAEIIAGGNYKRFSLFSKGTVFDEAPEAGSDPERIFTHVYGGYAQISKTLAEKFKVTGSLRYDNMKDFKGQITPRASVVYSPDKNNNIRLSYQTGFRYPDQIQQFIYFPVPGAIALGGVPSIASRYGVYDGGSYTISSYTDFASQGGTLDPTTGAILTNPGNVTLETANVPYLKPEELRSFEIGYNSIIGGVLLVDLNYYHTSYTNFLGDVFVASKTSTTHRGEQIDAGSIWALYTNSPSNLTSDGFGVELTYNLPNNFVVKGNYTYATVSGEQPDGFLVGFNTPRNRINLGFSNRKLTEKLGFNMNFSYQDDFLWESQYGTATMPSYTVFNAQVNYKLPSLKTIVKIGGTNIGGSDYRTNFGSAFIGQTYYVSLVFDELLRN